jgi:hypothetical protein
MDQIINYVEDEDSEVIATSLCRVGGDGGAGINFSSFSNEQFERNNNVRK